MANNTKRDKSAKKMPVKALKEVVRAVVTGGEPSVEALEALFKVFNRNAKVK